MSQPQPSGGVYRFPEYYALGYRWNTAQECNFLEACLAAQHIKKPAAVLDIGCGAGRHLLELAKRGHAVTGFDLRPEMVEFVRAQARQDGLKVDVSVGDLRRMSLDGTYGLAICLMDTFRFLLTNEEIIAHLRAVAERLQPGGLYITDFWVPLRWEQLANEIYRWEQTDGGRTVRVFYLQHPETVDPVRQTFEDELVFTVEENGASREIRGERTRTRLILPQEFQALAAAAGAFTVAGTFGEFDLEKTLEPDSSSWRMISVLKKL